MCVHLFQWGDCIAYKVDFPMSVVRYVTSLRLTIIVWTVSVRQSEQRMETDNHDDPTDDSVDSHLLGINQCRAEDGCVLVWQTVSGEQTLKIVRRTTGEKGCHFLASV